MRRFGVAVLIVMVLVGAVPGLAQDWQTYSDDWITFEYPAGWYTLKDEDGSVLLSNMPIDPDSEPFAVAAGQVTLDIRDLADMTSDELVMNNSDPFFTAGFSAGVLWMFAAFTTSFGGQEMTSTVYAVETATFGKSQAAVARFDLGVGDGVEMLLIVRDDDYSISAQAATGELAGWEDSIFAVVESFERTAGE